MIQENGTSRLQQVFIDERQNADVVFRTNGCGHNGVIVVDNLFQRSHRHRCTSKIVHFASFLFLLLLLGLQAFLKYIYLISMSDLILLIGIRQPQMYPQCCVTNFKILTKIIKIDFCDFLDFLIVELSIFVITYEFYAEFHIFVDINHIPAGSHNNMLKKFSVYLILDELLFHEKEIVDAVQLEQLQSTIPVGCDSGKFMRVVRSLVFLRFLTNTCRNWRLVLLLLILVILFTFVLTRTTSRLVLSHTAAVCFLLLWKKFMSCGYVLNMF